MKTLKTKLLLSDTYTCTWYIFLCYNPPFPVRLGPFVVPVIVAKVERAARVLNALVMTLVVMVVQVT